MDKNLRQLIAELTAIIDNLEAQLGDVPAALEKVRVEGFDAGKMEGDAEGYARGYAEGAASVQCPVPDEDRKFTQGDLDAAVEQVRAALTQEMEGLRLAIIDLQDQLAAARRDTDAKILEAVTGALAAFKAELKAKYAEAQAKEAMEEAAFGELLNEVEVPMPEPTPEPVEEPAPIEPLPVEEAPIEEAPIEEAPVEGGEEAPPAEDTQV